MTSRKVRLGIIGTGWWATQAHIPAVNANPDAVLVALADTRPEALTRAATHAVGANLYHDYREMLAQEHLDGVIISVHHAAHYEVARDCLAAGVATLLEKPMVLYAPHAYELEQLAQRKNVPLMIGYSWLHTDFVRQARRIILSGELGRIQYVSCLFSSMVIEFLRGNAQAYVDVFKYPVNSPGTVYSDVKRSGGGQGHLQVTHSAASMFYLTGLRAERVTSFMENFDLNVDLADAINVRFAPVDGVRAVGVVGSTGNITPGDSGYLEVQVYCENGRVTVSHHNWETYVRRADGTEQRFTDQPHDISAGTSRNLVDVILGRAENGAPAEIGVRVVELLDAAYRSSAADGSPIAIASLVNLPQE
jgi:predicted dehydrogenase